MHAGACKKRLFPHNIANIDYHHGQSKNHKTQSAPLLK
jgi:hypothetical protein